MQSLRLGKLISYTPIYLAAMKNKNLEVVKTLLMRPEIKKNFKIGDSYGNTPIYEAIMCGNIEAVKLLMSHKNIKLKDEEINLIKENFGSSEEIINLLDACKKRKREEQKVTVPENLNIRPSA